MMRQVLQKRTGDELQQLLEAFQSVTGVTGDPNDPELDKVFQVYISGVFATLYTTLVRTIEPLVCL